MTSLQRVHSFLRKSPEQRWITARFVTTMWLAKLPYAPHRVHLRLASHEHVEFWWSYFPASFSADRSMFAYWGDDIGELRFLWKSLRPGMIFLDVGAYHGIYSIIAAKRLGHTGRVVAFEPSPRDRRRLQLHLRYNGIKTAKVEPYALAGEQGRASLFMVADGYTNMNSLRPPSIDHPVTPVTVETTTLDEYLSRNLIDSVDLVKIDAEGGEIEILRGAGRLLTRQRPLVICELLDRVTRPWGYSACKIVNCFRTYEYDWFDIRSDGSLVSHRPRNEYPNVGNYLAVPRERQRRLSEVYSSASGFGCGC